MGVAAFILAMAYRSYRLTTEEEVGDDPEDAKVSELAATDTGAIPEDRPRIDITRDTDAPDELDALPGYEGSK
jgi:multicomponent Na+:H+ antiporter subunit C